MMVYIFSALAQLSDNAFSTDLILRSNLSEWNNANVTDQTKFLKKSLLLRRFSNYVKKRCRNNLWNPIDAFSICGIMQQK